MRRAVKVSLAFATQQKRSQINALMEAYRAAVNFYIRSLWNKQGKLDQATCVRLKHTRLSARYKGAALKQAFDIVAATRKSARALGAAATCPIFNGAAVLSVNLVSVQEGQGSFDLAVKLSTLNKGHRITIPTRKTTVFNKWQNWPESKLIQGCALSEDSLILWFEIPESIRPEGVVLGVDIGIHKLLSDSNGEHYGKDFQAVRDKIKRRKPGSKGREKAFRERENLINRTINQLPFANLRAIGVEALHDVKRGKQSDRGKTFRKAIAPWTYRQVLNRIEDKAQENR
ncbi:MAG: hypothetical protein MN733_40175, partial [Nitrososphaera sp.]|nr:hypothetical protein [Nitrososphaera sp.]